MRAFADEETDVLDELQREILINERMASPNYVGRPGRKVHPNSVAGRRARIEGSREVASE